MKKTYFPVLVCLLLTPLILSAQRHKKDNPLLPSFGQIDKSDLEMTTCPFDSGAEAENLEDESIVSYDSKPSGMDDAVFVLKQMMHERYKIFRQSATDLANVKIPLYVDDEERVEDFKAQTYNLDSHGNIVVSKLAKKEFFLQHIDKDMDEFVVTLPDVKPGSVIEYEYTKYSDYFWHIPTWYFQSDIPSRYSYFEIQVPKIFNFTYESFISIPFTLDTTDIFTQNFLGGYESKGTEHIWAMKNIPGLRDEPYMTDATDYLQHIIFQLSTITYPDGTVKTYTTTWAKLIDELMNDDYFGRQLDKNIPDTKDFIKLVSQIPDKAERMYKIYDYVRSSMNWDGNNSYGAYDNINKIWDKRSGTSGEINLILIDLMKRAGLDAFPLLVSTRDHGKINLAYPFKEQFNKTVAYVWANNRSYILDASKKYLPYTLVPYDILNTYGYLVSPDMKGWIPINEKYYQFKNQVSMMASVTPDGLLKGEVYVNSYDYSRAERAQEWKDDKSNFKKDFFSQKGELLKVDSIRVNNLDNDSLPLEQIANFSLPVNSSGNYIYFNTNLFTGLDGNPFVSKNRFSDVDFGYDQSYSFTGTFLLPKGYTLQQLPQNIAMIMPDTSIVYIRTMIANARELSVRYSITFKKPVYTRDEYAALQDFYKKLFAKLNEQVVLMKND